MITAIIKSLFIRDLNRLYDEIALYKVESNIWKTEKQIANSAGNLCLHLNGNLNTYIGQVIGKTGYIRDREAEFTLKHIPREQLLDTIRATIDTINSSLDQLNDAMLEEAYPLLVFDQPTTTGYLLIHLATHLTYHLGQINYHRRFIDL